MVTDADLQKYGEIVESVSKKWFDGENQDKLLAKPNMFTTFM